MTEKEEVTLDEVADLLRSVEFAMSQGRTAMVAFFDTKYGSEAIQRDYDRMTEVLRQVKAMLDHLPSEPPMTPEREARVAAVVGAALRKRFGEGTKEEVDAAVDAWLEHDLSLPVDEPCWHGDECSGTGPDCARRSEVPDV